MVRQTQTKLELEKIVLFLFMLILFSPLLLAVLQFQKFAFFDFNEFFWAFKNSLMQSTGSAIASTGMGIILALGLFFIEAQNRIFNRVCEFFALVPNFLPSLFSIILILQVIEPFPMGHVGVVLVNTTIYSGLAAVLIKTSIQNKTHGHNLLPAIEGASQWQYFNAIFPLIRSDLLIVFMTIFMSSFSSFSVPFVVGGSRATNLEILIYEKIKISDDWGAALSLCLFQFLFLGLISRLMLAKSFDKKINSPNFIFGNRYLFIFSALFIFGYAVLLSYHIGLGLLNLQIATSIYYSLIPASLIISLSVGLITWFGLAASCFLIFEPQIERVINFITIPSFAFVGFVMAMTFGFDRYTTLVVSFFVISFASVCRLGWFGHVKNLRNQALVAMTLGSGKISILKKILLPQLVRESMFYSSIAAIWMMGDFALSRVMMSQDISLAMLIQNLMSSYRIDSAFAGAAILILCGSFVFIVFNGVGYVLSKRLS